MLRLNWKLNYPVKLSHTLILYKSPNDFKLFEKQKSCLIYGAAIILFLRWLEIVFLGARRLGANYASFQDSLTPKDTLTT